ncbi:30S ribosomal protein S2 [Candidatus Nomurabacteria bacterium]|nr:30S ribosomal protein S2 [Candidatus Nomurabacteria bacterium]
MQKAMKTQPNKGNVETTVEQMFEVGAHYGYGKSRRHQSVSPFIYTTKNKGDIINLEKTSEMLVGALEFVKELGARGKTILFVGTKPEAKLAVQNGAMAIDMPYVTARWIGGTLSNFTEIKKRINELENYRKESLAGGLEKYTKKERVVMAKKMEKLSRYYSGLVGLKKAPDALFIIDPREEHIAATEAQKSGITVVALANSDSNIRAIDYPIIGNDASIPSVSLFTTALVNAYKQGALSATKKE